MANEVIEHGIASTYKKEVTCFVCECVYLISGLDIVVDKHLFKPATYRVQCPECTTWREIIIPQQIQTFLKLKDWY